MGVYRTYRIVHFSLEFPFELLHKKPVLPYTIHFGHTPKRDVGSIIFGHKKILMIVAIYLFIFAPKSCTLAQKCRRSVLQNIEICSTCILLLTLCWVLLWESSCLFHRRDSGHPQEEAQRLIASRLNTFVMASSSFILQSLDTDLAVTACRLARNTLAK